CHAIWDKIGNELREIETPFYLKINRFAPFKGRATDVDVVQDLMIHDIDLMLYLFNEKPISLESKAYKMRTDKWDHCIAEFKFANGSKAVITSGRNSTYEVREFELATESGVKRVDLMNNHFAQTNKTDYGLSNSEQVFVQEETYSKRDHLMIEHDLFYQSIINNTKEFVDFKSGKEAVYLVSEVLRSVNQEDLVILKYE
ncbi:MAG: putative dehydrogenase, partial [Thermoproteota archaeon]